MIVLPEPFVKQMKEMLGEKEYDDFRSSLDLNPSVSFRINAAKVESTSDEHEMVPWCSTGYYLHERPSFTFDPLFHAGCYYVQEASSMFIEQAFRTLDFLPRRVLDLCAAPGGKSTLWRSLLPDGALLVANEPLRQRSMILVENMVKWGHPDVAVTQSYPIDFAPLTGYFDVIAADVPCSGEGMFRKDANAIGEWSPQAVEQCAQRQFQIIRDVWPALRSGGILVYSTCTYNRHENEDNVKRICDELGAELLSIPLQETWNIRGDMTGRGLQVYHFFPHRIKGEGFFIALLRKIGPAARTTNNKRRGRPASFSLTGVKELYKWIRLSDDFKWVQFPPMQVVALRKNLLEDIAQLSKFVRVLFAGIPLAEEKGRKYVPCHQLAMSNYLSENVFPRVPLNKEQAINYLSREAVVLPSEVPRGYVIPTYENHPLGFLNNLGNRANNLYPSEWRIRTRLQSSADLL